ncbi:reprolysin-like metallopeptidase [Flavobacterium sp.]|uniref:zinc-dependent metalloprotease n=1 Tax=Flavobacterium sp. TaxID=239 RepID=UPI00374DD7B7
MKKQLLLVFVSLFGMVQIQAQTGGYWSSSETSKGRVATDKGVARLSFPKEFKLYDLNLGSMRETLFSTRNITSKTKTIISLPNADGQMEEFEMFEASNFDTELQERFPEIRAYSGKGITDRYATLKLSISPQGIQTMVFRTDKENEFIEPYSQDHTVYAVFKSQREKGKLPWSCSTDDQKLVVDLAGKAGDIAKSSAGELKTMRLAQSCNGEYANYFGATSSAQVGLVLAAFNATLTRCNGVYEKDLALHLNLVAGSTNVIYYNPATDPYSTTLSSWNTSLQIALNTTLTGPSTTLAANNAAYDIGHMFGATGGGGNAGCIGCPCVDGVAAGTGSTKGRGITSPADGIPQGDNFDIDYVVHEIGHQLGGNHTFSMSNEGAGVNKEVGSGITIMGYAGITSQDIAPHSIAYYHEATIAQIQEVLAGVTCPITTSLAGTNATPVVSPVSNYTIPISTPFILTGSATDANAGDALTYSWEQNDDGGSSTGAASSASTTKTVGPNFISFSPTVSPSRYFPRLASVISNSATTGLIGTPGDAGMLSEALSSVARTLNFRLTVRDNSPYSSTAPIKVGQTAFTDMTVTVDAAAGPFSLTIPSTTGLSYGVGTNQTVTWNVASTNTGAVNTPYVDLYLSADGGNTYPILLASKVPNDGSETITIPNSTGATNRLMARGNGNIFFDISNNNFTIAAPVSSFAAAFNGAPGEQNKGVCQGVNTVNYTFDYTALSGFSGTTAFSATSVPVGTTVTFTPTSRTTSGTVTMAVNTTASTPAALANIIVNATSGATTKTVPFYLDVQPLPSVATLNTPVNNATLQNTTMNLVWTAGANTVNFDIQVASDIAFTTIVASGNTSGTTFGVSGLSQATDYWWRVRPNNAGCSAAYGTAFKFTTGIVNCSTVSNTTVQTIASNGKPTVTSTISIPSGVTITDLNLGLNITHTVISDLIISLASPTGTSVTVFNQVCASNDNINATYDDSGMVLACGTNPAVSGTVIPLNALSAFNGQSSTGTWTLTVADNDAGSGGGGSLNSWSLNICNVSAPLSNPEFELNDISLFPNPNTGNFNVRFTSASTNEIKINVHDMRGRQVYEKSFSNTGAFNQNVNLSKVQAGIYLVSIIDGAKKTVKRIVVE